MFVRWRGWVGEGVRRGLVGWVVFEIVESVFWEKVCKYSSMLQSGG